MGTEQKKPRQSDREQSKQYMHHGIDIINTREAESVVRHGVVEFYIRLRGVRYIGGLSSG